MATTTRQALQHRSARQTPLKRFLTTHRIKVSALAVHLGLNRAYLSLIVNGWAKPATVQFWGPKIAAALEVDLELIFPKHIP